MVFQEIVILRAVNNLCNHGNNQWIYIKVILTFMSNSLAATLGEHEEQSPPDNDLQREEYLSICPFNYYPSILFVHSSIIHPFYLSIQHTPNVRYVFFSYHLVLWFVLLQDKLLDVKLYLLKLEMTTKVPVNSDK